MQKSVSLKYEPASEPLYISAKQLFSDGTTNRISNNQVVNLLEETVDLMPRCVATLDSRFHGCRRQGCLAHK